MVFHLSGLRTCAYSKKAMKNRENFFSFLLSALVICFGFSLIGKEQYLFRIADWIIALISFLLFSLVVRSSFISKNFTFCSFAIYFFWGGMADLYLAGGQGQGIRLSLMSLCFLLLIQTLLVFNEKKCLDVRSIFLALVFATVVGGTYVLLPQLVYFFDSGYQSFDLYTVWDPNLTSDRFLSRATGSARIAVIMFFLLYGLSRLYRADFKVLKFGRILSFFGAVGAVGALSLVTLFLSRGAFLMILVGFSLAVFLKRDWFYDWAKLFSASLLLSIVLVGLKFASIDNTNYELTSRALARGQVQVNPQMVESSGRLELWEMAALKLGDCMFGCGFQFDRLLLNDSVANGLIYGLLSTGPIPIVFLLLSSGYFVREVIARYSQLADIELILILIMIILVVRSLFESSFMVFGFDQVVFVTALGALHLRIHMKNEGQSSRISS